MCILNTLFLTCEPLIFMAFETSFLCVRNKSYQLPLTYELFSSPAYQPWTSHISYMKHGVIPVLLFTGILYVYIYENFCVMSFFFALTPQTTLFVGHFFKIIQCAFLWACLAHLNRLQVHTLRPYFNCERDLFSPSVKETFDNLVTLSHTTMSSDTICWRDKHFGETPIKVLI